MDIKDYYEKKKEEGSLGRAQYLVGRRYLLGQDVEQDLDKAEKWLLRAWDHHFPGVASTQTFILKRQWEQFVSLVFEDKPKFKQLLMEAKLSASEEEARITIVTNNDAQREWLQQRTSKIIDLFNEFTNNRFYNVLLTL